MVGYGPEDNHFVTELTYNYGVAGYRLGNDLLGITLQSKEIVDNVKKIGWPLSETPTGDFVIESPGGYKFYLVNKAQPKTDPVQMVTLAVSNLERAIHYWSKLLGMKIYKKDNSKKKVLLGFGDDQCKLELQDIGEPIDHASAFGRIAFSCPKKELPGIEMKLRKEKQKILTALVRLDTPGKATVEVVILADPDGHEICLVGDAGFRLLSAVDPNAVKLLDEAMAADNSTQWFVQNNMQKTSG
ncbi:glyoxalase domain-containing protein 4 isoform X2 [Rhinoraja longicauda]